MNLDAEALGVISGVVSSVISACVGYGVLRSKVERIEKDIDRCVSLDLFNATISALREDLQNIRSDVRELLRAVQRSEDK